MTIPPLATEDHVCASCRLRYDEITVDDATERLPRLADDVRAVLDAASDDALRRRPTDDSWCAVEYLCHLRDVYVTSTIRLHRVRTEDRPVLEPMLNDLRARRFGYRDADVPATLAELSAAVSGFLAEVARVEDWDRTATRLPGEERTALWLVCNALHEGVHHLEDLEGLTKG